MSTTGQRWRSRIHRSIIEKVHSLWPPREAALLDAMVIGEDAFINRSTCANFQRSGTYHVLVVSGMNVSILALVTFWFLRQLRVSDPLAGAITVSLMVASVLLTALGTPVWRATLMLAFYLGARLLYREKSMLNAIAAAALGLMINRSNSYGHPRKEGSVPPGKCSRDDLSQQSRGSGYVLS